VVWVFDSNRAAQKIE